VIVTQVVPFPGDSTLPIVGEYRAALKQHDPEAEPGVISFEGFNRGEILTTALRNARRPRIGRP